MVHFFSTHDEYVFPSFFYAFSQHDFFFFFKEAASFTSVGVFDPSCCDIGCASCEFLKFSLIYLIKVALFLSFLSHQRLAACLHAVFTLVLTFSFTHNEPV